MMIKWRTPVVVICVSIYLAVVGVSLGAIVSADLMTRGVIVVDAGHGGKDGGVVYGDMIEADVNLELSKILKKMLEKRNFRVVMTRIDDNALADGKKADMQERQKIIENARPLMTVSMHINKFADRTVRGVRVFYDDAGRNKQCAEIMQSVLNDMINKRFAGRYDYKAQGGDFFITNCSASPAIIIECGFISNAADRALLQDSVYKETLCDTIAAGIDSMVSQGA